MKNWFLHILLLAGLFGMLTTSCSQDEEVMQTGSENGSHVQLRFTIVMDDSPSSRTWGGNYEAEVAAKAENAINNIQVLLFSSDGATCYGALENVQYFSVDELDKVYEFQGSIPLAADNSLISNANKLNCKIMVLANCSIPENTANTGIAAAVTDLTYIASQIYSSTDGLKAGIPMWGITTVSNLNVEQGWATSLPEDIYMLRSMAKIEVTLSDATYTNGYRITGATLNNYNTQGYVVPAFMIPETDESTQATTQTATLSGLSKTTDLLTNGVYRPITGQLVTTGKILSNIDNKKTYVIYVPEMAKGTDAAPNKVSLNLGRVTATDEDGIETITDITNSVMNGTPHIVLKDYAQGGSHFDITRNHWYQYTINQINDGANIDVTCQVQPWELQQQVIDYTSEPAAADGGKIDWIGATPDASNQVTLNSSLEAQCKFTLNSPLGYQWVASLVPVGDGASAANSPFRFVTNGQVAGMDTSGIIDGKPVTLTIKSTATDGVDEDKAVLLQIIVIKGDGTSVVLDKDVIGGPYTVIHTK